MLFKVQVSTEIMVAAENQRDAEAIAKIHAPNEVATYGKGQATPIKKASDIPEDWKKVIPYSKDSKETRYCIDLAPGAEVVKETPKELPQEDLDELIRIKNSIKNPPVIEPLIEVKPESRPDPKPKDLAWHETKSGRPMKQLRFVR